MNPIVAFALRQRIMVLIVLGVFLAGGAVAFRLLNIEAYPDPVPPMVEIVTQNSGQSASEIERSITIPVEIQLAGIKNVKKVETISLFGLSDVRVQFTFDYDYEQAKQQVINALSQLPPMPNGAQPGISPTSPIGEIYRYRIRGPKGYSVTDLKTIQDWILQRRFKAVPGVIDVNGWAGKSKTYEVTVDQRKLVSYGLSLAQVLTAINNANGNVGGQTIQLGPQAAVVRGVGLIHTMDDIRDTLVATPAGGRPVQVKDIATVSVGNEPRLGIVGQDEDDDIVQGIILMRRGEASLPTLKAVEAEIDKVNNEGILPPGVHLEKIYDRTDLIDVTTHTVLENMVFGVVLIFLVQWVFLGTLRSAVIVAATIPFALAFAIIIMVLRGESANLLSVGAIDFGLIVDATVIMVENIFRHLAQPPKQRFAATGALDHQGGIQSFFGKLGIIELSATEVNRAIFFAAAIIIAGFLPLFTLSGVEGHIFGPMAKTYAYAIVGGLIATFTVAPVLSALLLREHEEEKETLIVRAMRRVYDPAIRFALANRIVALGGMGALLLAAGIAVGGLGLEFLPKLEEGNFWIRATLPPSISLEEAQTHVNRMRHMLMKYPEVKTVISQLGRPDDGTDTTGFFNAEFYVPLKPSSQWPSGMTKEKLTRQVNEELAAPFPGVEFNFSQNIEDNVEEAASGVKGANSVKLYGNDLESLEKTAYQIKSIMAGVRGITDLSVFDALGQPTVNIKINRDKAAHYGLAPGDINAVVQAAIGGQAAGNLYEYGSDRNFPIMIRLAPQFRDRLDAIRAIPVAVPNSTGGVAQVPLSTVADVNLVSGYSFIYRENQSRYIPIKFSVRGRDLGGAVLEAQQKIDRQVSLPPGSRLEWVGEFGDLQAAMARLEVVVPISLALIMLLLFLNFGSLTDMALAASVMPMALVGGVLILAFTGTAFSVSAAIGFIGLFGISVMEGILVLAYFNQLLGSGMARSEAVLHAARTRFRPVMMTCIAACVGLLPAAVATGIGSQVQKPLALVVVGGILLAPVLILIVLPVMIDLFSKRQPHPARHQEDVA
ncbi:efflux RND transporter permease subunit [Novosphingobium rosa]|uniref:efflux RND transporter permease subunit n=1 Tax=Novosphingobium rosa TaxID=76978 RepID=UPI000836F366|nr:CusA/CzcA family heavy metal efflux RND transporter [Novosphingobium rosa]